MAIVKFLLNKDICTHQWNIMGRSSNSLDRRVLHSWSTAAGALLGHRNDNSLILVLNTSYPKIENRFIGPTVFKLYNSNP